MPFICDHPPAIFPQAGPPVIKSSKIRLTHLEDLLGGWVLNEFRTSMGGRHKERRVSQVLACAFW